MSPTLKSTGVVHFGTKSGEEGVDRCKPTFNAFWDRHGAVECAKEIVPISSAVWAQCTNVTKRQTDRQTNRPRNGYIDRHMRITLRFVWDTCIFHCAFSSKAMQLAVLL